MLLTKKQMNEMSVPYDSPINMMVERISSMVAEKTDDGVYKAVLKTGITVDKDKLQKILDNDKERYQDAFRSGYLTAVNQMKTAAVIPLDELCEMVHEDSFDDVWLEQTDGKDHYVRHAFIIRIDDDSIMFCSPIKKVINATAWPYLLKEEYDKAWRCWTNKPTLQQIIDREDECLFCE